MYALIVHDILAALGQRRVFDLSQPLFVGMPHYPTHPPFLFGLTKKHGDLVLEGGVSSSADAFALGGHVGTHIDALCHFSCDGKLFGGVEVSGVQSYADGVRSLSVDTIAPILRRGVLLDIAGAGVLPTEHVITPEELELAARSEKVDVRAGDVVLLRTGLAAYWNDPVRFIAGGSGSQVAGPGPELPAARWLSERKIFAAGSDTVGFEKQPGQMQVHRHLLVESGIHIIENLNLEELAEARVFEFLFVALPLRIQGGTGSPIRPSSGGLTVLAFSRSAGGYRPNKRCHDRGKAGADPDGFPFVFRFPGDRQHASTNDIKQREEQIRNPAAWRCIDTRSPREDRKAQDFRSKTAERSPGKGHLAVQHQALTDGM